jgi:hypothetical protein
MMDRFILKSMKPPANPQWQGEKINGAMTMMVTVQPVGWIGAWHENPKPQWIIPLSGRWFVEAMDGTSVEMGAGELSFGGDQNCREADGKLGHRSGTVGEEPAVLMVIQYDDMPAPSPPCEFR